MGLKVACGAWIDGNSATNAQEIASLIMLAKARHCDLAIVGSEVLHRRQQPPQALAAYILEVKQAVPGVPVTTADVYGELLAPINSPVIAAVDVLMPNYYPFWEGIDVRLAVGAIHAKHQEIVALAAGREVIVSESGWPSCGNAVGSAVPSPANQRAFAINFRAWATAYGVKYLYFSAFDEAWKARYEGPQGACWGAWTAAGVLKPWMVDLFHGVSQSDNWSGNNPPGGPGTPSIEFTHVPPYGSSLDLKGQAWHVAPKDYAVAVYIRVNGSWWTKPFAAAPVTPLLVDGSWTCDITTGGQDPLANAIVAFLIPKSYSPPVILGQATLPPQLDANAVAKISINRSP